MCGYAAMLTISDLGDVRGGGGAGGFRGDGLGAHQDPRVSVVTAVPLESKVGTKLITSNHFWSVK